MRRLLVLLFLLPLVHAYTISDYSGGSIHVLPGQEVNLVLPFPEGNDCLPVAVLFIKGGDDYPRITVNGQEVTGKGMHRLVLSPSPQVTIHIESNGFATLEGNSLIYCTKDAFVLVRNEPPHPVRVGNYNFMHIVLSNAGYSDAEVSLYIRFHPNLAPYYPPYTRVRVPARKKVVYNLFLVASPRFMEPAAHGEVCIDYVDSVMHVRDCTRPIPTSSVINPLIKCVDDTCINASNLELEANDSSFSPGDLIPHGLINMLKEQNAEVIEEGLSSENKPFRAEYGNIAWVFILIGLVLVVARPVGFI